MTASHPHVVFVTKSDLSGRSGHNIATRNVALALARSENIQVTVVCPAPGGDHTEAVRQSISDLVHLAHRPTDPSIPRRIYGLPDAYLTLRHVIRRTNPDLVIARMAPDMLAPAVLCRQYDLPYALLQRGQAYRELRFSRALTWLYGFNARAAKEVYVASDDIRCDTDELRASDQSPTTLLSNAVDPDVFAPVPKEATRESIGLDSDGFVVGFVGSMKARHRLDALIRSIEHIDDNDVNLLLVGDGPERSHFEAVAREAGVLDRVHFPGFVDHESVPKYLAATDAQYAVSEQTSATPVKVFESLACERPVIVREMEEMRFVREKDVGRTVSGPGPREIADAIRSLRDCSPSERGEMGERGRAYVCEHHTWRSFVDRILEDFIDSPAPS